MPGTARDKARTQSAINNYQASNYVRAPERAAQCLVTEPKPRGTEASRQSQAPQNYSECNATSLTCFIFRSGFLLEVTHMDDFNQYQRYRGECNKT